jgi:hypothetical protein
MPWKRMEKRTRAASIIFNIPDYTRFSAEWTARLPEWICFSRHAAE